MSEDAYRAGSVGADAGKWQAVADLPRFVELMRSRRQFVVGALIAFFGYTLAFVLVCGYAPGLMGTGIVDGFTIGMAAAGIYLLLIWLLAWAFLRRSLTYLGSDQSRDRRSCHVDDDDRPVGRRRPIAPRSPAAGRRGPAMTPFAVVSSAHPLTLGIFAAVIAVTLAVTYWAAKRTRTATEFWSAGRGISGMQNGFAIAGDWLSASSFWASPESPSSPALTGSSSPSRRWPPFSPYCCCWRAHAQLGQVHDRRRARVPPARAPGADRGGAEHRRHLRHVPDRSDGGRGRAVPGAGRNPVLGVGADRRRLHARVCAPGWDAGHYLDAGDQGLPAHA